MTTLDPARPPARPRAARTLPPSALVEASFGHELQAFAAAPLSAFTTNVVELRATLVERGAVLLRGFAWDVPELAAFVRALVPRPIVYGGSRARITDDDLIQHVEAGTMAVSPHCELAFTPFRPDLCIFACVRPAARGGRTVVADGAAILDQLDPETRARFEGPRAITYQRLFPASAWQRTFRTRSRRVVEAALARFEQVEVAWSVDDNLSCRFTTAAIVAGLDGRPAWANNVSNMVEAEGILGSTVCYADGEPLSQATRAELRRLLRAATVSIDWRPQDVLLIDNWRVLHGREGFADRGREIYAHFGNLRESTLRPEHILASTGR